MGILMVAASGFFDLASDTQMQTWSGLSTLAVFVVGGVLSYHFMRGANMVGMLKTTMFSSASAAVSTAATAATGAAKTVLIPATATDDESGYALGAEKSILAVVVDDDHSSCTGSDPDGYTAVAGSVQRN
jgi:hypothetical protein